jgi:hypothetical protein
MAKQSARAVSGRTASIPLTDKRDELASSHEIFPKPETTPYHIDLEPLCTTAKFSG